MTKLKVKDSSIVLDNKTTLCFLHQLLLKTRCIVIVIIITLNHGMTGC